METQSKEIEIRDITELPDDAVEVTEIYDRGTLRKWVSRGSLDTYILRDPPMQWSADNRFSFG